MPTMIMNRDYTVRSTRGHSLRFLPDTPKHVPEDAKLVQQCLSYGAQFVKKADADKLPGAEEAPRPTLPATLEEREKTISDLLIEMRDNQPEHRNNFTTSGRPNAVFVSRTVGFDVSAAEVKTLWTAVTKL